MTSFPDTKSHSIIIFTNVMKHNIMRNIIKGKGNVKLFVKCNEGIRGNGGIVPLILIQGAR